MRKFVRTAAGIVSVCVLSVLSLALYVSNSLPDKFYVTQGEALSIRSPFNIYPEADNTFLPVEAYSTVGNTYPMNLKMFGGVCVKQVQVQVVDRKTVIPCGTPFGIKLFTEGVIVVGMSDVETSGGLLNPAKQCGIQIGDIVISINGQSASSNEQIAALIQSSHGEPLEFRVRRGNKTFTTRLSPLVSETDGQYKAGIWVRDSSAGIGTMTYYDPSSGCYGGLGHAVCDVDTQMIMPLFSGEIVRASINGVNPGHSGIPGELRGLFLESGAMGTLDMNSETGVFGTLYRRIPCRETVEIAYSQEIERGPATILCTTEGETPKEFSVTIERINAADASETKNMVVSVTDPRLLSQTGGIVQGMSGSPILQNGKLIGAITHVFVNDPTRGYGIFIENMLDAAE